MSTLKHKTSVGKNIKKEKSKDMERAIPGSTGEGKYFRITIREKEQFTSFKTHDVGEKGGIQRVTGKRKSGSWATQAWLISKEKAQPWGQSLKANDEETQNLFNKLGSKPRHITGDIYSAKPEINVPEKNKPTVAQLIAWSKNIKKAQKSKRRGNM